MISMEIVQDIEGNANEEYKESPRRIGNKNSQLWTMIQKKRILIRTDFRATFPVQIILMSLVIHGGLA